MNIAQPMETAPKAKYRRVLILSRKRLYQPIGWKEIDPVWIECWWNADLGRWEAWCGDYDTISTTEVLPIYWSEPPEIPSR